MRSSGRGPASGAVDRLRAGGRKSDRLERADAPAAATVSLLGFPYQSSDGPQLSPICSCLFRCDLRRGRPVGL
jgi:hypothetical protein